MKVSEQNAKVSWSHAAIPLVSENGSKEGCLFFLLAFSITKTMAVHYFNHGAKDVELQGRRKMISRLIIICRHMTA